MSVTLETTVLGASLGEFFSPAAQAAPTRPQAQRIREWAARAYQKRNAYRYFEAKEDTQSVPVSDATPQEPPRQDCAECR